MSAARSAYHSCWSSSPPLDSARVRASKQLGFIGKGASLDTRRRGSSKEGDGGWTRERARFATIPTIADGMFGTPEKLARERDDLKEASAFFLLERVLSTVGRGKGQRGWGQGSRRQGNPNFPPVVVFTL